MSTELLREALDALKSIDRQLSLNASMLKGPCGTMPLLRLSKYRATRNELIAKIEQHLAGDAECLPATTTVDGKGGLHDPTEYISYERGEEHARLDGCFKASELRAIANHMTGIRSSLTIQCNANPKANHEADTDGATQ